jgi:hypothetical protein
MKLVIKNTGTVQTTVASEDLAIGLDPGEEATIDSDSGVVVYGPKPGVVDQFKKVASLLKSLVHGQKPASNVNVSAVITNCGTSSVRIIKGDGVTDETLAPNTSFSGSAMYLELRELGNAPQQGGTPD